MADRRLLVYKFVRKRYRAAKNHGIIIETEGGADEGMDGGVGGGALGPGGFTKMDMLELDGQMALNSHSGMDGGLMEEGGAKDEQNEARKGMARNLKDLKQRHPDKDMEQLIEMANYQVRSDGTVCHVDEAAELPQPELTQGAYLPTFCLHFC